MRSLDGPHSGLTADCYRAVATELLGGASPVLASPNSAAISSYERLRASWSCVIVSTTTSSAPYSDATASSPARTVEGDPITARRPLPPGRFDRVSR
jgi:hypothetical protein